ncbi:GtrA family protein [Kineococcus esterisolvens]|uniref:GtrA family protein n=1 Tax=unclassified Kineococcus TaxID=2621656 RepID=UPI003D7DE9E3
MDTATRDAPAPTSPERTPSAPCVPAAPRRAPGGRALPRFVLAGLAGNAAHAVVFLLLGAWAPLPVAAVNVSATVVSTLVANELHRRFTFRAAPGTPWFAGHGVGGAAAVAGLVLSTSALTAWHHLVPGAGDLSGLLVVHVVTGLVGLVNFLVLRSVLRSPVAVPRQGRPGG